MITRKQCLGRFQRARPPCWLVWRNDHTRTRTLTCVVQVHNLTSEFVPYKEIASSICTTSSVFTSSQSFNVVLSVNMGITLRRKLQHTRIAFQRMTMKKASITKGHDNSARLHSSKPVLEPLPMDILCGRDRNYTKHPGNQIYRQLLEDQSSIYETKLSKVAKMEVTKYIVGTMQNQHGSRFIRQTDDGWEELSNTQARDKTSHALRFLHKSNTKMPSCSQSEPFDANVILNKLEGAPDDSEQNTISRRHSLSEVLIHPNLSLQDSFETMGSSNIAIEGRLFNDIWYDHSHVRDDFGNFHEIMEFDSPQSHFSGIHPSDGGKMYDPPLDASSIFRNSKPPP